MKAWYGLIMLPRFNTLFFFNLFGRSLPVPRRHTPYLGQPDYRIYELNKRLQQRSEVSDNCISIIYKDESNENCKSVRDKIRTLMCAAVGNESNLHRLQACPMYGRYGRISSTKSPVSGAGNVTEPRLMSQVGRVHKISFTYVSFGNQSGGGASIRRPS
jgi:hypothetical protein